MQDGDMVRFDYTLYVDGADVPTDTSIEDVAKEHGIHREKRYEPLTITVGNGNIIPGFERHIRDNAEPGKELEVTVEPGDGYGERDPKMIQDIPMAQFRKQKVQPEVGLVLNLGGKQGVITRVAGGRVRVDANHELAGKTIRYVYTVRELITDEGAKVEAAMANLFPMGSVKFQLGDELTVEVPDQAKFDKNWGMAKFRVLQELRSATAGKKDILLVERYPADLGQGAASEEE